MLESRWMHEYVGMRYPVMGWLKMLRGQSGRTLNSRGHREEEKL
jgi:hypothetical protein